MISRSLALLALLAAAPAAAQSVTDYYHAAAQSYIGGQNAEAERAAEAGLALDPDNAKLQALLEKIRERNPDDSGGEQEQENAEQQEQGEGDQQQNAQSGEQEQNDAESDGEQPQQPEGEQQPEEPAEQEPQDEQQGDTGTEGDEQDPSDPQGGGSTATPFEVKPGEMSRAEAERILRAIESDELELLRDVQRRRARPRYVEKDW